MQPPAARKPRPIPVPVHARIVDGAGTVISKPRTIGSRIAAEIWFLGMFAQTPPGAVLQFFRDDAWHDHLDR